MASIVESELILCSTARLARRLSNARSQQRLKQQAPPWQAPQVQTLQQWLNSYTNFAVLAGEIPTDYFTPYVLNPFTEGMLWQQAIEQCLAKHEFAALFDVPSLASAAMTANQMLINWQIEDGQIQQHFSHNETQQFLRWRNTFFQLCKQHHTVTPAWRLQQQIRAVALSNYPLPGKITFAGFDRLTPLEQSLVTILEQKGISIAYFQLEAASQQIVQAAFNDIHAECRAAVAWAKHHLTQDPQKQLAIISPVQSHVRRFLSDLLDDTFHPQALLPAQYETPRIYDFSVGVMLSEQAICRTAFRLLRLGSTRQACTQAEISALLLDVYWSDMNELDARSLADAKMRKTCISTLQLSQCLVLIQDNPSLTHLQSHLATLLAAQQAWTMPQLPSIWVETFIQLLKQVNWGQTRPLSSHEFQTRQAWDDLLVNFSSLDSLTGKITAHQAVQQLQQLARNQMFMPEATGDVHIQLLGMLENLEQPIDAIWVMGMNDHVWPPATDLNPLLPATLQRQLQTPGATPDAQAAFARKIHARLCKSAHEVLFSWSEHDGDRALRVSPLLAEVKTVEWHALAPTLAEAMAVPQRMQLLHDHMAPAVHADETIKGGSQLMAAQAVCPAWAYYQYRLGARALEEPTEGLDSMTRGNLVHAVLQHFWIDCKSSEALTQLDTDSLNQRVNAAIAQAFNSLNHALPAQLLQLEHQRLFALVQAWLGYEMQRERFEVIACEAQYPIHIHGLDIMCRIDRIDAIDDGKLVIIDYKTGAADPKTSGWADARVKEPQLPLYASVALKDKEVVAVLFAKIHAEGSKFFGVSDAEGIPDIKPMAQARSNSALKQFSELPTLIEHWQNSLTQLADEIVSGVASVQFEDENALMYCDVKPLLRLPERALQFEMYQSQNSPAGDMA